MIKTLARYRGMSPALGTPQLGTAAVQRAVALATYNSSSIPVRVFYRTPLPLIFNAASATGSFLKDLIGRI